LHESKAAIQTQPNALTTINATSNGNHYATVAASNARNAAYTNNV
jgi:hypothetical protein